MPAQARVGWDASGREVEVVGLADHNAAEAAPLSPTFSATGVPRAARVRGPRRRGGNYT